CGCRRGVMNDVLTPMQYVSYDAVLPNPLTFVHVSVSSVAALRCASTFAFPMPVRFSCLPYAAAGRHRLKTNLFTYDSRRWSDSADNQKDCLQVSRQAVELQRPATLDKERTMQAMLSLPRLDIFDINH